MLFGYIFINHIQPFEAANISAAFFLCRPMRKQNRCHTFKIIFEDDILCALAIYSFIWDSLFNLSNWLISGLKRTKVHRPIIMHNIDNPTKTGGLNLCIAWGKSYAPPTPYKKALENRYRVEMHVYRPIFQGQFISKCDTCFYTYIFQGF